jgi:hypothetical protein
MLKNPSGTSRLAKMTNREMEPAAIPVQGQGGGGTQNDSGQAGAEGDFQGDKTGLPDIAGFPKQFIPFPREAIPISPEAGEVE